MPSKGKDFRLPKVSYLDYKQSDIDRTLLNLFPRLKFDGRGGRIKASTYTIDTFVDEFTSEKNRDKFRGFVEHRDVIYKWLETDLLDLVNRGRPTQAVVAPRPLHGNVYKFRNTKHARDYNTSDQLFWMLYHSRSGLGQAARDGLYRFIFAGLDRHSDKIASAANIDVEAQAILHLDDQVKQDKPDSKEPEIYPPLCIGLADILADDLLRLLSYERYMPRSVMVDYLKTLLSFHLALYHLRVMKLLPALVKRSSGDPVCQSCPVTPKTQQAHLGCPYQLGILVDMGDAASPHMVELAARSADVHYRRIPGFIHAQFTAKKLDEMIDTLVDRGKLAKPPGREFTLGEVLEFSKPKHQAEREAYFSWRLEGLMEEMRAGNDGDLDPAIKQVKDMGLSDFETYIEMLVALRGKYNGRYIKECLDSLLLKNRDTGLLRQPRGPKARRRFFMGTRLMEVLLQIAVLGPQGSSFETREIRIGDLLEFLGARYGLYIDQMPPYDEIGSPSIVDRQALRRNLEAFKTRLREIGFFQDLSDAYVTQTVTPRYKIG